MAVRERYFIGLDRSGGQVAAALVAVRGKGERMRPRHVASSLSEEPEQAVAQLLANASVSTERIAAIGAVDGLPDAALAQRTGIAVASRFAECDRAAGGNGGAVCAWADWLCLRHGRWSRVLVHLGEVASLTFVGSHAASCEIVAFDVGPGTLLMDELSGRLFSRRDADGALAARGQVCPTLLNELQAHRHFHQPPPKTTTPADWSGQYLDRLALLAANHRCGGEDLLATAAELEAWSVAQAVARLTERPHDVVLCGRGAWNIHLAGRIRARMCPSGTVTTEKFGYPIEAYRPAGYAILAAARIDAFAAHCPAAGGAARQVVLGSVVLP